MPVTVETLRKQANVLLAAIKALPEPDRTTLLREFRARFAASIETPTRRAASAANMNRVNETRREYGVSEETRAKLSASRKAAWARKKSETDNTPE